jgi:hypothetical protein
MYWGEDIHELIVVAKLFMLYGKDDALKCGSFGCYAITLNPTILKVQMRLLLFLLLLLPDFCLPQAHLQLMAAISALKDQHNCET